MDERILIAFQDDLLKYLYKSLKKEDIKEKVVDINFIRKNVRIKLEDGGVCYYLINHSESPIFLYGLYCFGNLKELD
jgi:hypothetical protein